MVPSDPTPDAGWSQVVVRDAVPADIPGICTFGATHIRPHYTPLIGAQAADDQVRQWWSPDYVTAGVAAGAVVVATRDGQVVGVGQRGRAGPDHAIYKLYVDPTLRGAGLGPRLIAALVAQLPGDARRLLVEHVAANTRAAAFYEREGFAVDHVEAHPSGDPARATIWRTRDLRD